VLIVDIIGRGTGEVFHHFLHVMLILYVQQIVVLHGIDIIIVVLQQNKKIIIQVLMVLLGQVVSKYILFKKRNLQKIKI